jgi:HlyD family secretion protein
MRKRRSSAISGSRIFEGSLLLGRQFQRQAEIERVASPDQLDLPMRVTTPISWAFVFGVALLIGALLYWLIFGSIPEKIQGQGMILAGEQVPSVQAPAAGRLVRFLAAVGDPVKEKDPVAIMELPELAAQIRAADERVRDLEGQNGRQSAQIENLKASYREQLAAAKTDLARLQTLYREQRIALPRLRQAEARCSEIEAQLLSVGMGTENFGLQLGDAKRELAVLKTKIPEANVSHIKLPDGQIKVVVEVKVRSASTGKVTARLVAEDELIESGQRILNLEEEAEGKPARFYLFVPLSPGKNIKLDMEVRVAPANVRSEDYGFLLGKVKNIGSQPVTPEEVIKIFKNEEIAKRYAKDSPYLVEVTLDRRADGKFAWTSKKGEKEIEVQNNTHCNAQIIVEDRAPITMIIPKIRQWLDVS